MNKPFDLKLFVLLMVQKIHIILLGTLAGALLVGVPYVLVNVVFADGPDYEATVIANETYMVNENGETEDHINEYTWNEYVHTDIFLGSLLNTLGESYPKEELSAYLSAEVPADLRKVNIIVTTKNENDTMVIASVVPEALFTMKDYLYELDSISITDMPETCETVYKDVRVLNAVILGAVLGLFFTLIIMSFLFILDDSVYIPLLFEKEYGIEMEVGEPFAESLVITIDSKIPEIPKLNEDSLVSLNVVSGKHNGKIIDFVINEVEKQGVEIIKAYLDNPNERLIKAYYRPL